MSTKFTTLPSGLRVLTDHVPGMESVALGAYFGVGGRYESAPQNGIAHLVEHMMYKGTTTRSARDIAQAIEGVGGQMNAYTGREVTAYHFHMLKEHAGLGLSVLSDMLLRSVYDEAEMDRERQVIIQEIGMNADVPDDLLFDLFQTDAYPDQPLGAPILGTAAIIENMPRAAVADYVRDYYAANNVVISAAGAVQHEEFVEHVQDLFADLPQKGRTDYVPARYQGGSSRTSKPIEQTHILYGFQGIRRQDPRYYDMVAMAHILGSGNMSCRLWHEIREQRGLAYSIYAFHSAFHDDGIFGVYAAVSPTREDEALGAIKDEVRKMADTVTEEELQHTKNQMKASLLMGRESMTSRADQNAKYMLFHGRVLDTHELRTRIDGISSAGVMAMAEEMLKTPSTCTIMAGEDG